MAKKILVISGSPKKDGNTATLIKWFSQGAREKGARIEIIQASELKIKVAGCNSCRACQKATEYKCFVNDEASPAISKMAEVDVIVMATPLYFFSASAQIKVIFDRMFALYKWDNKANTMQTVLKGKTFAVIASAFEDVGLDALLEPFKLTADYSDMKFASLLIPNAGVSGGIKDKSDIRQKAIEFGKRLG